MDNALRRMQNVMSVNSPDKSIELYPIDQSYSQKILGGVGDNYIVVKISDGLAAKTSLDGEVCALRREHKLVSSLYHDGIRVPRPEGVYEVPFALRELMWNGEIRPAFVMEFIEGKHPNELFWPVSVIAKMSTNRQLRKARRLGYYPFDTDSNYIWAPYRGGSVLIDFQAWLLPKQS